MTAREKRSYGRIAFLLVKWGWFLLCVALLGLTLAISGGTQDLEAYLVFAFFPMVYLTFPLGALFLLILVGITSAYESLVGELPRIDCFAYQHLFFWAVLFVGGYLQWFVLVPRAWRTSWLVSKFKRSLAEEGAASPKPRLR